METWFIFVALYHGVSLNGNQACLFLILACQKIFFLAKNKIFVQKNKIWD